MTSDPTLVYCACVGHRVPYAECPGPSICGDPSEDYDPTPEMDVPEIEDKEPTS